MEEEPGMWEESFKSYQDSKPHGKVISYFDGFCISLLHTNAQS